MAPLLTTLGERETKLFPVLGLKVVDKLWSLSFPPFTDWCIWSIHPASFSRRGRAVRGVEAEEDSNFSASDAGGNFPLRVNSSSSEKKKLGFLTEPLATAP